MEDDLKGKKTLNGKSHNREDDLKWKMTSKGRKPQMEDYLRWKMFSNGRQTSKFQGEYLGNPGGNLQCGSAQPSLFEKTC